MTTRPSSPTGPPLAVEAAGLRKAYGDHVVLDGVDLRVAAGTVYGLLGPNGAGKSTIVHLLSTLLPADGGTMQVAGHDVDRDPDAVRRAIGVTGQFSAVDGLLTGRENLRLMADLHHLDRDQRRRRPDELLELFDLVEAADKPAGTYSGGMRRRLDLAMTLVGRPSLIFLDEPTTGLDPRSRHEVWTMVRRLVEGGVTIFLTTQYLDEADELADRIAVLDAGRIVAEGTPDDLKRRLPAGHIRVRLTDADQLDRAAELLGATGRDEQALTLEVPNHETVPDLKALLTRLDEHAIAIDDLSIHSPDLDDVFFAVTGAPRRADLEAASALEGAQP